MPNSISAHHKQAQPQHESPVVYTQIAQQIAHIMPDNLTAGPSPPVAPSVYPPLARLSSSIDDRRNESLPSMLSSFARSQLTPEKIRMVMAHPMLGPIARANLINAQMNDPLRANGPGVATPLGDALGFSSIRR